MENIEEFASINNSYLTFKLGKEHFAAHASKVLNILELTPITYVPKSPQHLKGVTNLRGSVLPVIDTRIKFGMSQTEYTNNTCILVLSVNIEDEEVNVGALVDSVQEVVEVDDDKILDPPSVGSKYKSEYVSGILKVKGQFIMLLEIDKIFATDDVIKLKETEEGLVSES